MPDAEKEAKDKMISKLLADGFIRESRATTSCNLIFVPKRNGELRPCGDYRNLNAVVLRDYHPLPLLKNLVQRAT